MARLPRIEDIEDDGSSKEWRELGPKIPDDEFIPLGAITFREFRDWLGKAMFPDDWTGEECAGWFSGSFGLVHRSEAERDADLERRHAESAKQHELAGRPVPATPQIETAPKKRISRTPWEDAELDGGIDDTDVPLTPEQRAEIDRAPLIRVPLTPEQRAEIDRKLKPLYGKAQAVKDRREMVEPKLQKIFGNGTLGAFYISQDDGQKMDIAPKDWRVKRRRGNFHLGKIWLHEAGFFHVEVSGERRKFTILIDAEKAKAVCSDYKIGGTFRGEPSEPEPRKPAEAAEKQARDGQVQDGPASTSETTLTEEVRRKGGLKPKYNKDLQAFVDSLSAEFAEAKKPFTLSTFKDWLLENAKPGEGYEVNLAIPDCDDIEFYDGKLWWKDRKGAPQSMTMRTVERYIARSKP